MGIPDVKFRQVGVTTRAVARPGPDASRLFYESCDDCAAARGGRSRRRPPRPEPMHLAAVLDGGPASRDACRSTATSSLSSGRTRCRGHSCAGASGREANLPSVSRGYYAHPTIEPGSRSRGGRRRSAAAATMEPTRRALREYLLLRRAVFLYAGTPTSLLARSRGTMDVRDRRASEAT